MRKRNNLFFVVIFIILFSSSCSNKKIEKLIQDTSTIQIELYGLKDDCIKTVKTIEIVEPTNIANILKFITNKNAPFYKCGYNGKLILLDKHNKPLIDDGISFNVYPDCQHCVYMIKNKIYSKKLSDEGFEYIQSLLNDLLKDIQK